MRYRESIGKELSMHSFLKMVNSSLEFGSKLEGKIKTKMYSLREK
jgi:hypothetical protein